MNFRSIISSKYGQIWQEAGNEYKVTCPVCGGKSFFINPKKDKAHCFRCELSGSASRFLSLVSVRDLKSTIQTNMFPVAVTLSGNILPKNYRQTKNRWEFEDGWDYVKNRGVNPDSVEFGRCNGDGYVYFPMREGTYVVYWQARAMSDVNQKNKNPTREMSGIGKSNVVYRVDSIYDTRPAIVTEGIFDALVSDGVATLGKDCSTVQAMKILGRNPSVVYICYDPDAWDYATRTALLFRSLSRNTPTIPIRINGKKDPADLGRARLYEMILSQAVPIAFRALFSSRLSSAERWLLERLSTF